MPRSQLFHICFLSVLLAAPVAQSESDPLVDAMAADFFEQDLRRAQSDRIEAATAAIYRDMDETARADFRAERLKAWRAMSAEARESLRGAKTPQFENLTEDQKAVFRDGAARALGQSAEAAAEERGI